MIWLWVGLATAGTLEVGSDKPYATVQEAVDDALAGDVVRIDEGSWSGFVSSTPGLTFEAADGVGSVSFVSTVTLEDGATGTVLDGLSWDEGIEGAALLVYDDLLASELSFEGNDGSEALVTVANGAEAVFTDLSCRNLTSSCVAVYGATASFDGLLVSAGELAEGAAIEGVWLAQ